MSGLVRQCATALAIAVTAAPACRVRRGIPLTSAVTAPIVLFNGVGTSANDVAAIEDVLDENGLVYATADSSELNTMSATQLRRHRLLIFPGGRAYRLGRPRR